jgi:hypothetical protein
MPLILLARPIVWSVPHTTTQNQPIGLNISQVHAIVRPERMGPRKEMRPQIVANIGEDQSCLENLNELSQPLY